MKEETHTIFASDVEEFSRYTSIIDEFKGQRIQYLDSTHWTNLSNTFHRSVIIKELKEDEYKLIYYRYSGYKHIYIYRKIPKYTDVSPGALVLKLSFTVTGLRAEIYAQRHHHGQAFFREKFIPFLSKLLEDYICLPKDPSIVRVAFTHLANTGDAHISSREIVCPSWKEIKPNYPSLQSHIESLLTTERPDDLGKFIFWHGDPGSGKSFLIRGLMREWKQNVDFIYVIDPERFFNDGGYMKEILISNIRLADDEPEPGLDALCSEYEEVVTSPVCEREAPLKLFIIEDGLNFLLKESRVYESGAMSRLLNLTDGILGQGLRLLFLVTSNEKEQDIDPAFLRSGRCLQRLKFNLFTSDQAKKWLKSKNHSVTHIKNHNTYTLSDLYAEVNKTILPKQQIEKPTIGIKAV